MDEFSHIQDPGLRELYEAMHAAPYQVLGTGERLLEKAKDKLAVLEAMEEAVRTILDDLAEHGAANRGLYGNHRREWFEEQLRRIERRIKTRRARGDRSTVFARYRRAYQARISQAADGFIEEMDADEKATRAECTALQGALTDAARFIEGLRRLTGKGLLSEGVLDAVTGLTSNALREHVLAGNAADACRILEAYAPLFPRTARSRFREELAGNAIHVVLAAGREDLKALVLERLTPSTVTNGRLAFNLACLASRTGDRAGLLSHAARAIALGKRKAEFLADADFDAWRSDPDFLRALGG